MVERQPLDSLSKKLIMNDMMEQQQEMLALRAANLEYFGIGRNSIPKGSS
jgi:hypothetical protein